jgi:hypothetical protein
MVPIGAIVRAVSALLCLCVIRSIIAEESQAASRGLALAYVGSGVSLQPLLGAT